MNAIVGNLPVLKMNSKWKQFKHWLRNQIEEPVFPDYEKQEPLALVIPNVQHRKVVQEVFASIRTTMLYQTLLSESEYTPEAHLMTLDEARSKGMVGAIPTHMDAPVECIEGSYISRHSYTVWVLFDEEGIAHVYRPTPTTGRIKVGCDIITLRDPAEAMPDDVTAAIKVQVGIRHADGMLKGCRWTFYE